VIVGRARCPRRSGELRIDRRLAVRGVEPGTGDAELSRTGGDRVVSLAQAVVRRPSVLLLDEPTSNLDLRNQLHILRLVKDLAADQPAADLVTVHDLNLVARFADQAVVMDAGTVYGSGAPAQVITETMLREVYQIEARIQQYEDGTVTLAATRSL
jgi:iron complex transport system ATP-binding protein